MNKTFLVIMLFLRNKRSSRQHVSIANLSLLDRGIWTLRCKDLSPSPWPCIQNDRTLFRTASYSSSFMRSTTPPYLHTSLLTYFGSPITPISLLSDVIHHRSGFSPRPPHPTYLGTYVLLLYHHSSHPCLLWTFHLHSLSSNTTTFKPHTNVQYVHAIFMNLLNINRKINIYMYIWRRIRWNNIYVKICWK